MKELSPLETKFISAAYYPYVTPEWKESQCTLVGITAGMIGAAIGGASFQNLIGILVGGWAGYLLGYTLCSLEMSYYQNHHYIPQNTYYSDYYYVY